MSAFDLAEMDTPETIRLRALNGLSADELLIERYLQTSKAWFPYRRLDHVNRTHEFVRAYDRVFLSMVNRNAELPIELRVRLKHQGHYLPTTELLAPWIKDQGPKKPIKESTRWPHWVKARRSADRRCMIYDDYVAGALIAALKRGWEHWPAPNTLHSDKLLGHEATDGYIEATIPAYETKLYEKRIKTTEDPYFTGIAFRGDPLQFQYCRHFAGELVRVYVGMQRVEQAWRGYQKDGKIHASLSLTTMLS